MLQTIRPFGSGTGSPGPASGEQKDSRYYLLAGGFYEQLTFIAERLSVRLIIVQAWRALVGP